MRNYREIRLSGVGWIIESSLKAHAEIGIDNDSAAVIEVDGECRVRDVLDMHLSDLWRWIETFCRRGIL